MGLNELGSVASVLSLVITIFVFWGVNDVKNYYVRHIMLPPLIRKLRAQIRNIENSVLNKRVEELQASIEHCDVLLERLYKHTDNILKKRIKENRDSINTFLSNKDQYQLDNCRKLVSNINATIESTKVFQGEDQWSTNT